MFIRQRAAIQLICEVTNKYEYLCSVVFLMVPWLGMWSVIVAFPVHSLVFVNSLDKYNKQ